ncbi:m-AAA protease-interacting protein 1, mitochondrial isoform 5-T5 [Anableps anableps]
MLFLRGFAVCTTCFGPEPAVKRTVKMVSLLFRCYSRLPSASALTLARFVLNQNLVRNHRCCLARAGNLTTGRSYSSERDQDHPKQKVVVVGIPNPFIWFRTRIYYFLIRTYFDKEFSIEEFTEGAKQAFSHVSRLLSRCQFEALDGLVAKDVSMMLMKQEVQSAAGSLMMSHGSLIGKLEEKCASLPASCRSALSAEPEDIMYTTPGDVGIFYDDSGSRGSSPKESLRTGPSPG